MKRLKQLRCALVLVAAFLYLGESRELDASASIRDWNECYSVTPEEPEESACETEYYQVYAPGNSCEWWCNNDIEDTCADFCGEDWDWSSASYCDWDLLIQGTEVNHCVNWYIHCGCVEL